MAIKNRTSKKKAPTAGAGRSSSKGVASRATTAGTAKTAKPPKR